MGIGNIFKGLFKKKEVTEEIPELPKPDVPRLDVSDLRTLRPESRLEPSVDTTRAKMDVIAAYMESLKLQYENLNARIERMEKMLQEIYIIAKR